MVEGAKYDWIFQGSKERLKKFIEYDWKYMNFSAIWNNIEQVDEIFVFFFWWKTNHRVRVWESTQAKTIGKLLSRIRNARGLHYSNGTFGFLTFFHRILGAITPERRILFHSRVRGVNLFISFQVDFPSLEKNSTCFICQIQHSFQWKHLCIIFCLSTIFLWNPLEKKIEQRDGFPEN